MVRNVNKVILIGNVGQKPELRQTKTETPVTDFSIAMSEKWRTKNNEERSETTWAKIVCWGRLAESIVPVIEKVDLVYVEGKLSNRSYEKDGVSRQVTEIEAFNVLKMDSSRSAESAEEASSEA
jgi:single-strand DNA-binding protein